MTYTLEGDDASLYEIDSETGEIKVKEAYTPDYETKDSYNIVVKAVDANGNEVAQDITVPVEDIESEGPTIELAEIAPSSREYRGSSRNSNYINCKF